MRTLPFALAALLVTGPALAAPPPPYARHVCPNGLEVLVVERHTTPLMTVEIGVHNGAMTEPPEYNGLSHLYEHMFFKGNKALPDQLAYTARMRELGMLFNGSTDDDLVNYYFTTTSDHYADAMVFMRDAITSPLFDPKELERERVVVTGEMDRDESQPTFLLWRAMEKLAFWKYPSRKNALGDRKTVLATTPEQMRTIQHRYYVPNNSVLVVTGDVHAEDVFKRADELYAAWAKAPDPFLKYPLVHHPAIRRSEATIVVQPVQTFRLSMEWQGPSTLDATAPAVYASDILIAAANNQGSRFQKTLVDSGTCASAWFSSSTERDVGPFWVDAESNEGNAETCTRAVVAELSKLVDPSYFSDDELANAAKSIDIARAKKRESTEEYAHLLTFMWANADLDWYATFSDHAHAVTRSDLAKFLQAYVLGKPFVAGALESAELAKTIDRARLEALVGISKVGAK